MARAPLYLTTQWLPSGHRMSRRLSSRCRVPRLGSCDARPSRRGAASLTAQQANPGCDPNTRATPRTTVEYGFTFGRPFFNGTERVVIIGIDKFEGAETSDDTAAA